jgi:hypothetical protein
MRNFPVVTEISAEKSFCGKQRQGILDPILSVLDCRKITKSFIDRDLPRARRTDCFSYAVTNPYSFTGIMVAVGRIFADGLCTDPCERVYAYGSYMDPWRQNCLPHTAHSLEHAAPALCREHLGLNDVLHGPCPSLLVHRYYGTVRLLQHVHVRRSVYGLRGPALIVRPRSAGDLPVLVHVVS